MVLDSICANTEVKIKVPPDGAYPGKQAIWKHSAFQSRQDQLGNEVRLMVEKLKLLVEAVTCNG